MRQFRIFLSVLLLWLMGIASVEANTEFRYRGLIYDINSDGAYVNQYEPFCNTDSLKSEDDEMMLIRVPDKIPRGEGSSETVPVKGITFFYMGYDFIRIELGSNTDYLGLFRSDDNTNEVLLTVVVRAENVQINTGLKVPNQDNIYSLVYIGQNVAKAQFDPLATIKPVPSAPAGSQAYVKLRDAFNVCYVFNYFDVDVVNHGGGQVQVEGKGDSGYLGEQGGSLTTKYSSYGRADIGLSALCNSDYVPLLKETDSHGTLLLTHYASTTTGSFTNYFYRVRPNEAHTRYEFSYVKKHFTVPVSSNGGGSVTFFTYPSNTPQTVSIDENGGQATLDYWYNGERLSGGSANEYYSSMLCMNLRYDRTKYDCEVTYTGSDGTRMLPLNHTPGISLAYIKYLEVEDASISVNFKPLNRKFSIIANSGATVTYNGNGVLSSDGGQVNLAWDGNEFRGELFYNYYAYSADVKLDGKLIPLDRVGDDGNGLGDFMFGTPPDRDNAVYTVTLTPHYCVYELQNLGYGTVTVNYVSDGQAQTKTIEKFGSAVVKADGNTDFIMSSTPEFKSQYPFYYYKGIYNQGLNTTFNGHLYNLAYQFKTPQACERVPIYIAYRITSINMLCNMPDAASFTFIMKEGQPKTETFPVNGWVKAGVDVDNVNMAMLTVKTGNGMKVLVNGVDKTSSLVFNPSSDGTTQSTYITDDLSAEWMVAYTATDAQDQQNAAVTFGVTEGGTLTVLCKNMADDIQNSVNVEQQPNRMSTVSVNDYHHIQLQMVPRDGYKMSKLIVGGNDVTESLNAVDLGTSIIYTYNISSLYNTTVMAFYEPLSPSEKNDLTAHVSWAGNGALSRAYTFYGMDRKDAYLTGTSGTEGNIVGHLANFTMQRSGDIQNNKLLVTPFEEDKPFLFFVNGSLRTEELMEHKAYDYDERLCYYWDLEEEFANKTESTFTVLFNEDPNILANMHGDDIHVRVLVNDAGLDLGDALRLRYNEDADGNTQVVRLNAGMNDFYINNVGSTSFNSMDFNLPVFDGYSVHLTYNGADVSSQLNGMPAWQFQGAGDGYRLGDGVWSVSYVKRTSDVNGDGKVTIADAVKVVDDILDK